MYNVLSIGNSFSQDAQRYLYGVARADGVELFCENLYIGGCSLWRHFRNLELDNQDYELEVCGQYPHYKASIRQALLSQEWDCVTIQQVSNLSPRYETFQPYLTALTDAIRRYAPGAKLALHQTWAYAQGSDRLHKELGYGCHTDMTNDLIASYATAAAEVGADLIIPSGKVMENLQLAGAAAHRDGFHASKGVGRYAIALGWYHALTGSDIAANRFADFDVPVSDAEIAAAKKAAMEAFEG